VSDTRLVLIALVFLVVIFLAATVFQTPIAQVLDTIVQAVRLTD